PEVSGGPGDPNGQGPHQSNSWWSHAVIPTFQAPDDPTLSANGTTWGNRGATSFSANWHVYRGGWGEDWQMGGVTRFPQFIRDGTSNTIFIATRYSVCGDPTLNGQNEFKYVEHIWGEDGQGSGPTFLFYHSGCGDNNGAGPCHITGDGPLFAPSFFALAPPLPFGQPNPERSVPNYPWAYMSLPQILP